MIDEGLFGYGANGFKSASDLEVAEERLNQLAFRKELEDKAIKFVRDVKEYSVFADPRLKDRIVFRVFKRSIQRERVIYKPLKRRKIVGGGDFYILDSWKNIAVIFNKRFSQLVKQ